ncbi:hypothetical protein GGTG_04705 [Gaeumannomyces tritici R3-111a-1]|uniref:Uncharacterized protein n=1 Tax=Gaeumannomyces tritici (strain R3-111a-1) TaxID=644352 RepID=J3NTV6_GAET3|nr:hypothetical protein GGTG_04705 [Gaeumannomyces tritici R3-111a-1]EJT79621.1 hypothetical protein GGTG_04705 [Gaeumannomyces tritici R3-111a-1]
MAMSPDEGVSAEMQEVEHELEEKENLARKQGRRRGSVSPYALEMGMGGSERKARSKNSRFPTPPRSPSSSRSRSRSPSRRRPCLGADDLTARLKNFDMEETAACIKGRNACHDCCVYPRGYSSVYTVQLLLRSSLAGGLILDLRRDSGPWCGVFRSFSGERPAADGAAQRQMLVSSLLLFNQFSPLHIVSYTTFVFSFVFHTTLIFFYTTFFYGAFVFSFVFHTTLIFFYTTFFYGASVSYTTFVFSFVFHTTLIFFYTTFFYGASVLYTTFTPVYYTTFILFFCNLALSTAKPNSAHNGTQGSKPTRFQKMYARSLEIANARRPEVIAACAADMRMPEPQLAPEEDNWDASPEAPTSDSGPCAPAQLLTIEQLQGHYSKSVGSGKAVLAELTKENVDEVDKKLIGLNERILDAPQQQMEQPSGKWHQSRAHVAEEDVGRLARVQNEQIKVEKREVLGLTSARLPSTTRARRTSSAAQAWGAQAGGDNPFAQLWMVYAKADKRWAGADLGVISLELFFRCRGRPGFSLLWLDAHGPEEASIIGTYDVKCQEVEERWPDKCQDGLTITISTTTQPHIFVGTFRLGPHRGIMLISARKYRISRYSDNVEHGSKNIGTTAANIAITAAAITAAVAITTITFPRDFFAAYSNYQILAALNGNSSAMYMLGLMHSTGVGGVAERDQAKALLYYTFAALRSHTRAQMTVAVRHAAGIGTAKKREEACKYYKLVADKAIEWYRSGPPGGMGWASESHRIADGSTVAAATAALASALAAAVAAATTTTATTTATITTTTTAAAAAAATTTAAATITTTTTAAAAAITTTTTAAAAAAATTAAAAAAAFASASEFILCCCEHDFGDFRKWRLQDFRTKRAVIDEVLRASHS